MAKADASSAAGLVASLAHQVHGAIGMTQEYELQHYTRRLWAWRQEFGSERWWYGRIGAGVVASGADGLWDRVATGLEVALELGPLGADLVRSRQRVHPLIEGTLRRGGPFMKRLLTRRHGRRVYRLGVALQALTGQFTSTSSRGRAAFSSL